MTVLFQDTFIEASVETDLEDHTVTGTDKSGWLRTGTDNVLVVNDTNNRIEVAIGGSNNEYYYVDDTGDTFPDDGRIRWTQQWEHNSGGKTPVVCFRGQKEAAPNKCYGVQFVNNNEIRLRSYTDVENDVQTQLNTDADTYSGSATGLYYMQVDLVGTSIQVRAWTDDYEGATNVYDDTRTNSDLSGGTIGLAPVGATLRSTVNLWIEELEFDDDADGGGAVFLPASSSRNYARVIR